MIDFHVADRVEPLARRLADILMVPPADPMTADWVAVPSEGMRRWLALSLAAQLGAAGSAGDGVAANIIFAFPGSLRLAIVEAGRDRDTPDPWRTERLAWAVLEVLERHAGDPRLSTLLRPAPSGSRYSRARRVADLFDRYHLHRAEMVRAWATGRDVDAGGRRLAEHYAWQPHLWRLVRDRLGEASPPELLPALLHRLRAGTLEVDLPERFAIFGLTLLPGGEGFLELVDSLAVHRSVHVFLLEPSPALAARIRGSRHVGREAEVEGAKGFLRWSRGTRGWGVDPAVAHPLLRSWGRLAAETAALLGSRPVHDLVDGPGISRGRTAATPNVLHRLQEDLRLDRAPAGNLRPSADDRSVQFHACHGATRQVEVLRDAILHCLADDPTLREEDIVVLCPSLARFSPVVEAVLGPSAGGGLRSQAAAENGAGSTNAPSLKHAPSLRYRIADRSLQTGNPVAGATTALLELVSGRYAVGELLDFLALGPLRERHGLDDEDLAQIAEWAARTNVRWGLDADHREAHGVPASIRTNTWMAAVDRLLLGSAVYSEDLDASVGDVVPYGVEGDDAVLAGRLAEVIWRLGNLTNGAQAGRTVAEWAAWLGEAVDALFAAPPGNDWQIDAVHRQLFALTDSSERVGGVSDVVLEFSDFRRAVTDRLRAASGRPDFFRGGVTFTSMEPLRSVPHRVVCLLGVDQTWFAPSSADGDDLAADHARLGDRDPRGGPRLALLEAVLAAGDRLILLRDGHDVRTNHEIPPAVVVAELRDAVLASVHPDCRERYSRRLEFD
ncbi:MAG: exodeoxyribonuclease V subunit gamma, partial [Acidimicrobiaceae bacterium]|nr:exodeoxyribonuclease V subunit gamma [Acidimicrobiaceae bacterium]